MPGMGGVDLGSGWGCFGCDRSLVAVVGVHEHPNDGAFALLLGVNVEGDDAGKRLDKMVHPQQYGLVRSGCRWVRPKMHVVVALKKL